MTSRRLAPADAALVRAAQAGLPMVPAPYEALALQLGVPQAQVLARLQAMLEQGLIRRIGAVPNHYALGFVANGMCVWDVDDGHVDQAGQLLGALPDVSHCYRRPRHRPLWPYNLFAMLHGTDHGAVRARANAITEMLHAALSGALRERDILFSTAILKKTGLRLRSD